MSEIPPDVLGSIREILRIGNELREHRIRERQLEKERTVHRETVLEHYQGNVRFVTPVGNVIIRERESPTKFSLEDIRDILSGITEVSDEIRNRIQERFDEEAERHTKTTRTLTVQRQQTLKARRKRKRPKSQTLRHTQEIK